MFSVSGAQAPYSWIDITTKKVKKKGATPRLLKFRRFSGIIPLEV
jgi:hypothetical protein